MPKRIISRNRQFLRLKGTVGFQPFGCDVCQRIVAMFCIPQARQKTKKKTREKETKRKRKKKKEEKKKNPPTTIPTRHGRIYRYYKIEYPSDRLDLLPKMAPSPNEHPKTAPNPRNSFTCHQHQAPCVLPGRSSEPSWISHAGPRSSHLESFTLGPAEAQIDGKGTVRNTRMNGAITRRLLTPERSRGYAFWLSVYILPDSN